MRTVKLVGAIYGAGQPTPGNTPLPVDANGNANFMTAMQQQNPEAFAFNAAANASYNNPEVPVPNIDTAALQLPVTSADVTQILSTIPSVNLSSDQSATTKVSPYFMGPLAPNEEVDPSLGYQVQQGDSLIKIAGGNQTYGGAIANANNLTSDFIYPGQQLTMPTNYDEGAAYITGSLFNTQDNLRAAAFGQAQNLANQIGVPGYAVGTSSGSPNGTTSIVSNFNPLDGTNPDSGYAAIKYPGDELYSQVQIQPSGTMTPSQFAVANQFMVASEKNPAYLPDNSGAQAVPIDPIAQQQAAYANLTNQNSLDMAVLGIWGLPAAATRYFGGSEYDVAAQNQNGVAAFGVAASVAGIPDSGPIPIQGYQRGLGVSTSYTYNSIENPGPLATSSGAGSDSPIVLDLFGGKTSQIPGAINVDIIAQDGVQASATQLPFKSGSANTIIATNPYIPDGTGMMDFLPEAARVVQPGGQIIINSTVRNPFGDLPDIQSLNDLGLTVIQDRGPLLPQFQNNQFFTTTGKPIPAGSVQTTILQKTGGN